MPPYNCLPRPWPLKRSFFPGDGSDGHRKVAAQTPRSRSRHSENALEGRSAATRDAGLFGELVRGLSLNGEFPLTVVSENDFGTGWGFTQGQHLFLHAEMLWHRSVGFYVGGWQDSGSWRSKVKGWHGILENSWYFWRWQKRWRSWIQGFHPQWAGCTNEPRSYRA